MTFHALENSAITTGNNLKLGYHTVIHGGPDVPNPESGEETVIGNDVNEGTYSVVFRSVIGNGVKIGNKVLLDRCDIPEGAVISDGTVMVNNVVIGHVP